MRATKGNKVYTIDETQKAGYIAQGFDIVDDMGQIIAYGRGKTVPYGDYVALAEQNQMLQERIAELEKKGKNSQRAGE